MDKKIRLVLTNEYWNNNFQDYYAVLSGHYYQERYENELFSTVRQQDFIDRAVETNAPLLISGGSLSVNTILELAQHVERLTYVADSVPHEDDKMRLIETPNITAIIPFKQTILPHYANFSEITLENMESTGYADWFMAGWLKKKIDPRSASYSIFSKSAPIINEVNAKLHETVQAAYDHIKPETEDAQ